MARNLKVSAEEAAGKMKARRRAKSPAPDPGPEGPRVVKCPFTVVVDTAEREYGYTFNGIPADVGEGGGEIEVDLAYLGNKDEPADPGDVLEVETFRFGLPLADYSILYLPQVIVERKTLPDLYGSISRRENFAERLGRMQEKGYAAVVVEAQMDEVLAYAPGFGELSPKVISRTIQAWTMDYDRVHWWFMPGRRAAEVLTFRLLNRYYRRNKDKMTGNPAGVP